MTDTATRARLDELAAGVGEVVRLGRAPQQTADLVAAVLRTHLPASREVTGQDPGSPGIRRSDVLYTDPDGAFTIISLFWQPGQVTRIHDHVAWCVFGVIKGAEYEELFTLAEDGTHLVAAGSSINMAGEVSGFAPPGDIHRVRNPGSEEAISIHIYGADVSAGSSVRRFYDLPVRPAEGDRR
jgi:predicted metal-dependent enzyme (double-stranded beta helix superfamily)